jgi:hypothetical protein
MFLVSGACPRRLSSGHPLRLGNIDANSTVIHSSCEKHHRSQRQPKTSHMSPKPKERRWYGIFSDINALNETGAALG